MPKRNPDLLIEDMLAAVRKRPLKDLLLRYRQSVRMPTSRGAPTSAGTWSFEHLVDTNVISDGFFPPPSRVCMV